MLFMVIMRLLDLSVILETLNYLWIPISIKSARYLTINAMFRHLNSLISAILMLMVAAKTFKGEYGEILKEIQLKPTEAKILRRKVIKLITPFILFSFIEHVTSAYTVIQNPPDEDLSAFIISDKDVRTILHAGRPVTYYFSNLMCSLLTVIADYVGMKLHEMENELKSIQSPHKMIKKVNQVMEEYEKLQKVSTKLNSLLSTMNYILLLVNIMPMSANYAVLHMFDVIQRHPIFATLTLYDKCRFYFTASTYLLFPQIHPISIIHYIWKTNKINSKRKNFLGKLMAVQLVDKDILPYDLAKYRVDQLCWIINHLIKADDDWFTLGFGLTFDLETLLGVSNIILF
ncbi:hypothetical protein CHUAL_006851 [Chamberlinius hualienensis]